MARVFADRILVAIDVGTTKICVIVAQKLDDNRVEVLGIGKAPSDGLRKGVVVDVAKTIHSVKAAVKEAEIMSGVDIESAYVGISGGHIQAINSQGLIPLKKGRVRQVDIDNVMAAAQAIPIAQGQQILHTLAQYFVLDGQERVHDPRGMHGIRLEVMAHIILGSIASVQNLVRCCEMAGVKVKDIILEQLASAQAVLSADELELGTAVLDIGGGTSDLALYQHGNIRHTKVIPVAGSHFTNDVAIGLRTTIKDAERVKIAYGLACIDLLQKDDLIEVESVHGNQNHIVQVSELIRILQARAQEILLLIHEEVFTKKVHMFMPSGLVITGGGALLPGIKELGERIFNVPIRIGHPRPEFDLPQSLTSPIYATSYGLIMFALKQAQKSAPDKNESWSGRIALRMKSWVSDFF